MKKAVSSLLVVVALFTATSAMAATGISDVETSKNGIKTFAADATNQDAMPQFQAGDQVSFEITGTKADDDITLITYKYNEEPSNSTVQYINQYVAKGETQAVSYKVRDLSEGVYQLKVKVSDEEVKTVYYSVGTSAVSTVAVTGVQLDRATMTLKAGDNDTLIATVSPEDATDNSVTWTTSDPAVATVENGVVTAVAVGTATITATTTDGNKTATCTVTVTENQVSILYGDVNSSGTVDATDNIVLARFLGGWKGYDTKVDLAASDVNNSGAVDATDNIILARHLGGWKGYDKLPK